MHQREKVSLEWILGLTCVNGSGKKLPLIELNTSVSQEGVCIIVAPFVVSPCLLVILVAMLAQWTIEREHT